MPGQIKRAMVAGIVFVVLFPVGLMVMLSSTPDVSSKTSPADAANKFMNIISSSSHRHSLIIGVYLVVIVGFAFVWFMNGLRSLLFSSDAFNGVIVSCLSAVGAAALGAGAMLGSSMALNVSFGNEPLPGSGDVVRAFIDSMIPFFLIAFALTCAVLVALISVTIVKNAALPKWIGWLGVLAFLGAIGAVIFMPFLVTMVWFLIVAIMGLVKAPAATTV